MLEPSYNDFIEYQIVWWEEDSHILWHQQTQIDPDAVA